MNNREKLELVKQRVGRIIKAIDSLPHATPYASALPDLARAIYDLAEVVLDNLPVESPSEEP